LNPGCPAHSLVSTLILECILQKQDGEVCMHWMHPAHDRGILVCTSRHLSLY